MSAWLDVSTLTAAGSFLAGLAVVKRSVRLDIPTLSCCNAQITESMLPKMKALQTGYRPPLLHPTGLLQSRLADMHDVADASVPYARETVRRPALQSSTRLCCPDFVPAGIVSLDWLAQPDSNAPIVLLIPGLTGSSSSAYIRRAAVELHRAGFRVAAYSPRGRGGNELASPFMYSAGYTEDLRRVVRHVRAAYPDARLCAAGYSLGASYLGKYVGEEGDACPLDGAALFACPTNLVEGIGKLSTELTSSIVDRLVLTRGVQAVLREYLPALETNPYDLDLEGAAAAARMEAFDGCVIAPMMGCASATQYYSEASCGGLLQNCRIPTLLLSARNDVRCSSTHRSFNP